MRLQLRKPNQSLNKAYAKQSITQDRMDAFRQALMRLFDRLNEKESEEYQKNIVAGFLGEVFDNKLVEVATPEQIDLIVHRRSDYKDEADPWLLGKSLPSIIIETRKMFAGEMMTPIKNNVKALHELILYYFDEREHNKPVSSRHLIVTDVYNWFIFDETDFRQFFYDNAKLKKLYQLKQQHQKDNTFFYAETARILRELDADIPVTYVNLREAADAFNKPDHDQANRILIPVVKLFSPEHLLKLPFANDADTLNRSFYNELLHIVGLQEATEGSRKRIQRLPENERFAGSLLEQTISQLQADTRADDRPAVDENDRLFSIGLELCLTWLGRILFLKLLEGQLVRYHSGDQARQFLTARDIRGFGELSELFFEVMAVPENQRSASIIARFDQLRPEPIPYLNSSLFTLTSLEREVLTISDLSNQRDLPLFSDTILKDNQGRQQTGQLPMLQYLLTFLDSCDFLPDGPADVLTDNKPAINATSVGLIFEKLIGDRASSTPGFITAYLVRDAISRAVVSRFNDRFGWNCADIQSLKSHIREIAIVEANAVVNSLRIVDPAVGSGRLLVSALNELIALKAELGILADGDGRHLNQYDISVVNDELIISTEDGELVEYYAPRHKTRIGPVWADGSVSETQRVQETIFHEKKTLTENCLFGVDRNPGAVGICRLRLWIELLKSVYYLNGPGGLRLSTLPNIDININVGNSLVSHFGLDFKIDRLRNSATRERFLTDFKQYSLDVQAYKHSHDAVESERIYTNIQAFRAFLNQVALLDRKDYAEIRRLETKLAQSALTFDFINQDDHIQKLTDQLAAKKTAFADKQRMFQQAFEWRFEFPDVISESANYEGFDLVISRPPATQPEKLDCYKSHYRKAFPNTFTARADHYVMFVELGLNLLRPGGQLMYIVPTKWMRTGFGKKLRNWLKTKDIEEIIDFSGLPVSDGDAVWPGSLAVRNAPTTGLVNVANVKTLNVNKTGLDLSEQIISIPVESLPEKAWVFPKIDDL